MKKIAVFLAAFVAFATTQATAQQYYNISPKYIYEHQVMDSTHVGVVSTDTIWFNKTAATKDVNLYRSSANRLRTSDSLTVDGNLTVTGTSTLNGVATISATTAPLITQVTTASTANPQDVAWFNANSSGTPANTFGSRILLRTHNPNGNEKVAGIAAVNNTVDGSNIADLVLYAGTSATSPSEYARIMGNNGRMGLGTGTPSYLLHVAGTAGFDGVASFANGTAALPSIAGINDPNTGLRFPTNDTLAFSTGGTEKMRVDPSGNVGIGTTGPNYPLHVYKSTNAFTGIQVENVTNGTAASAATLLSANSGNLAIAAISSGYTTSGAWVADGAVLDAQSGVSGGLSIAASDAAGILRFYTGGSAAGNERVTILSTGSVGIGTTTPSTAGKLSVAGGVTIGVATTDTVLNAHHLRINNGGTFSEIVAGETAFDNVSDINVKQNIQPVDTDSIYSLIKAMNYPRKWQYKPSILRTQAEIDRINEATSDKTVTPIVEAKVDSLIKAKATGTFSVNTTQVPVVTYKNAIASIEPSYVRVGLDSLDEAIVVPADTTYKDVPETTYAARYDTVYTCSDAKRTQIRNAVLASQQEKATSELASYEARIAMDASRPHVSVMAQDMYPVSRLMKGAAAKETTLSGDDLINALLIAVKKQDERITKLEKRVANLEAR